jgi:hypothetical protein
MVEDLRPWAVSAQTQELLASASSLPASSPLAVSALAATWALSEVTAWMARETPEPLSNWPESSLPHLRDLPQDLRFSKK